MKKRSIEDIFTELKTEETSKNQELIAEQNRILQERLSLEQKEREEEQTRRTQAEERENLIIKTPEYRQILADINGQFLKDLLKKMHDLKPGFDLQTSPGIWGSTKVEPYPHSFVVEIKQPEINSSQTHYIIHAEATYRFPLYLERPPTKLSYPPGREPNYIVITISCSDYSQDSPLAFSNLEHPKIIYQAEYYRWVWNGPVDYDDRGRWEYEVSKREYSTLEELARGELSNLMGIR